MNHRYSYCKKDGPTSGSDSMLGKGHLELGSPGTGPHSDSRTTTPPSQLDSDERDSEGDSEDDEAMCMDDIRVVQVDDGECEIYEGNFDDEEEMAEEEALRQKEKEFVCDVVEIELGDEDMEDEEMEDGAEEEQEAAGVETEEMEDCEANTDKSIREESDGIEPTEDGEVVTNAK